MTSNHRKSEAKQQPSPYFYFFLNLWRNADRPVVVCYSLITRNAKLAALPQNSTLTSASSALLPCLFSAAASRDPVASRVTRGQGRRESLFSRFRLHCAGNRNHNGRALPTPRAAWSLTLSPSTEEFALRFPSSHLLVFAPPSSSDPWLIYK